MATIEGLQVGGGGGSQNSLCLSRAAEQVVSREGVIDVFRNLLTLPFPRLSRLSLRVPSLYLSKVAFHFRVRATPTSTRA